MKNNLVFAYVHEGNAYINLTNKCCNDCEFCLRRNGDGIHNDTLWLEREPLTSSEVIEQLLGISQDYKEVIFCGYGEPTYSVDFMIDVAKYAHANGKRTRLNTNGLGNAINGCDIVCKLKGNIDIVSISLNESTKEQYDAICHPIYGLEAHGMIIDFAKSCCESGIKTVMSVVDVISQADIDECQKIANSIGVTLRVRKHIKDNVAYN